MATRGFAALRTAVPAWTPAFPYPAALQRRSAERGFDRLSAVPYIEKARRGAGVTGSDVGRSPCGSRSMVTGVR